MKPTILLEGPSDIAILRAVLPPALVDACDIRATGGRSTLVSFARTFIIKHRVPTALMFDTDTLDPTVIVEMVQTTRHLTRSVAGDTPFEIVYCIPHIEIIFFDDEVDLRRIFPKFDEAYILQFARTQPKQQLEVLFDKGGGPRKLSEFLDHLTSDEAEKIRRTYPIHQLVSFIASNQKAAAHSE